MTDREKLEKLTELISEVACGTTYNYPSGRGFAINTREIANHLLAHGVTVREKQKPLTVEKLEYRMNCWYEENGEDELDYVMIGGSGYAIELYFIKSPYPMEKMRWEYGKTWRCWAEKPTDAERKAAEWE